jgi:hypothetical protein
VVYVFDLHDRVRLKTMRRCLDLGPHNPTLTAQALAWRTAEHLTKNWKAIARG